MNKYIVTSIQKGALVHKNFLDNLLAFSEKHNVEKIYCFVMSGRNIYEDTIDPRISSIPEVEFIYKSKRLNENLILTDSKIKAQSVGPFRGLKNKLSREYTHIVPSPKVRLQSLVAYTKHPRLLISTGALTQPHYHDHTYERPKQNGVKARMQHQQGFTYVEVTDNKRFKIKTVEAQKNGNFHFEREHWKDQKCLDKNIASYILGDLHNMHTFSPALEESLERIGYLKPKEVQLHDSFDGLSINHWERNKLTKMVKLYKQDQQALMGEVEALHKTLTRFGKMYSQVKWNIVYSNHDDRLQQYIDSKHWVDEYQNTEFSARLFIKMINGEDIALKGAVELIGKLPKNINFFELDEEYRIRGVLVSAHGHKGVSGSRGSPKSFSSNNLRACTGHTHTPELNENGAVAGTLEAPQDYTKGSPNSWLYANVIIYNDGSMAHDILEANFI